MDRPILLPVDGSSGADQARAHAFELARRYDCPLRALYVVDTNVARWPDTQESFSRQGEEVLARTQRLGAEAGLAVETDLRTGAPHEEILAHCEEIGAGTIVMGTHGRRGLDRLVLGSVTQRVVRLADVPVLTVGGPEGRAADTAYESVLLPTDGSEAAADALDAAVDLAAAYDASLHVLHVVETAGPGLTGETVVEEATETGEDVVSNIESLARAAGIGDVTTAVREGGPATEILAYSDDQNIGCIVMGTHGRTGLPRYLLGSTTERVLRTTHRPVLCVPTAPAEAATDE